MTSQPLTPEIRFAVDAFLLDARSRRLTAKTIKYYAEQLHYFLDYLAETDCTVLPALTTHHIRSYLIHLEEKGWKPRSQHAAARAIKAFLNFCVSDEWIDKSPMDKVRMPKLDNVNLPSFTVQDIQSLLTHAANQRDKSIVLCLLDTGCRANEFLAWDVSDVNIRTGTVRVRKTKNRQERTVYLGTRARKELLKLYARQSTQPDDPIWRSLTTGDRLEYSGLRIMLGKLGKRAGVKGCNAHKFRRTFALWSLRNGMNVFALQKIMGHSDLTILRRYLALVESDLKEAHDQFGAVDNMLT